MIVLCHYTCFICSTKHDCIVPLHMFYMFNKTWLYCAITHVLYVQQNMVVLCHYTCFISSTKHGCIYAITHVLYVQQNMIVLCHYTCFICSTKHACILSLHMFYMFNKTWLYCAITHVLCSTKHDCIVPLHMFYMFNKTWLYSAITHVLYVQQNMIVLCHSIGPALFGSIFWRRLPCLKTSLHSQHVLLYPSKVLFECFDSVRILRLRSKVMMRSDVMIAFRCYGQIRMFIFSVKCMVNVTWVSYKNLQWREQLGVVPVYLSLTVLSLDMTYIKTYGAHVFKRSWLGKESLVINTMNMPWKFWKMAKLWDTFHDYFLKLATWFCCLAAPWKFAWQENEWTKEERGWRSLV